MSEAFDRHGFRFQVAGPEHDQDIARLLNDNEIPGWIRLSYRTAPGWHRPLATSFKSGTVVGVDRLGRAGGVATRSVHKAFVGGRLSQVGWLGQLRIDPAFRNRAHLLRAGFDAVESFLHDEAETPHYYASIIEGNHAARRIMERGLAGFPRFEPVLNYEVIAIATRRDAPSAPPANADLGEIFEFLAANRRERDLAVAPSLQEVVAGGWAGLQTDDFIVLREGGAIRAVGAVWDQHPYRSINVTGYAGPLKSLRPLANLAAPLTRQPRLPATGEDLRQAYLSLTAVEADRPDLWTALTRAALAKAHAKGAALLAAGFVAGDSGAEALKAAFRGRLYRSTIYRVSFSSEDSGARPVLNRPLVEIGLL